jgi:RHS repeat-associated protein
MIEATTDSCTAVASHTSSTFTTDEWFTPFDKDGRPLDMWEKTPNSTQYYRTEMTYTGPALTAVDLASPTVVTANYALDGEGRLNGLSLGSTSYVTIPTTGGYSPAGQPLTIDMGPSSDNDTFTWDANTLLMSGWDFTVNSVSETGALTHNANNMLEKLVVTDGFNANGTITCGYGASVDSGTGYDDLGRLIGHSCTGTGGTWSQSFSFDQYNNITKSAVGLPVWNPTYSATTNHYACTGCTYDSNGDVTNDGTNAYAWNSFGKLASINISGTDCATAGVCNIYDALGRLVEFDGSSGKTEIWYTPLGKTLYMNGTSVAYGYFPAPGGGTLYYPGGGGTPSYMHKDWMGNARIVSTLANPGAVTTDRAYAPYGEAFNIFGGTGQSDTMFASLTQDIFSGMYDTPNREMTAAQSRFISPDPAGSGWNQYAWPTNPNSFADPSGLRHCPAGVYPPCSKPDPDENECAAPCGNGDTPEGWYGPIDQWAFIQWEMTQGQTPGPVQGSGSVPADGGSGSSGSSSTPSTPNCDQNGCWGYVTTTIIAVTDDGAEEPAGVDSGLAPGDVTVDASGDFINCPEGCAQIWSNADQISNPLTIVGWYGGSVVVGFALVPEAAVGAVEGTYSAWETFEFTYPGATADIIQQVTPPPSIPGTLPGLVVGLGVLADEWWEQE